MQLASRYLRMTWKLLVCFKTLPCS